MLRARRNAKRARFLGSFVIVADKSLVMRIFSCADFNVTGDTVRSETRVGQKLCPAKSTRANFFETRVTLLQQETREVSFAGFYFEKLSEITLRAWRRDAPDATPCGLRCSYG